MLELPCGARLELGEAARVEIRRSFAANVGFVPADLDAHLLYDSDSRDLWVVLTANGQTSFECVSDVLAASVIELAQDVAVHEPMRLEAEKEFLRRLQGQHPLGRPDM